MLLVSKGKRLYSILVSICGSHHSAPDSTLEAHLDGGEFTFIIPLNDNFTGGGTTFLPDSTNNMAKDGDSHPVSAHKAYFSPPVGHMLMFPGQKKHIGEPVTSGVR